MRLQPVLPSLLGGHAGGAGEGAAPASGGRPAHRGRAEERALVLVVATRAVAARRTEDL